MFWLQIKSGYTLVESVINSCQMVRAVLLMPLRKKSHQIILDTNENRSTNRFIPGDTGQNQVVYGSGCIRFYLIATNLANSCLISIIHFHGHWH